MKTYLPFGGVFSNYGYFDETMVICKNLKHLKEISGLSYRKLSIELGLNPRALNNYITNYVRPNRERLNTIVSYFEIEDIEDLCMNENEFKNKYPRMKNRVS